MNAMERKIPKHEQSINMIESRVSILLDDVNMQLLFNTILTVTLPTLETSISEQAAWDGDLKECFQSSLLIGPSEQPNRSKRCQPARP